MADNDVTLRGRGLVKASKGHQMHVTILGTATSGRIVTLLCP